jgi:hypothetical protein
MAAARLGLERPRAELRGVRVARTVQEPQPVFESFLDQFGARLGRRAAIKTIAKTHLTFLGSRGLARQFMSHGYTSGHIEAIRDELEERLRKTLPTGHATVRVNERAPLLWVGRVGTLALNIVNDDRLASERAEIEKFLRTRLGELPKLDTFVPHITLGRVREAIPYDTWREPLRIVPTDIAIPEEVALNGLAVYLGRFQPDTKVC